MTSGRIDSISPDWRGDTLAADVDAADTVLTVTDTADFDEDESTTRWLVIADSDPLEYVAVDHDANTVTLAGPAGDDYEAGLPVNVWDETVAGGGAAVVEYVAAVITDRGSVPASVPHELIPLAGADLLVGASVTLGADDDGDPFVAKVLGREPKVNSEVIDLGVYSARYPALIQYIGDAEWTTVNFGLLSGGPDRLIDYQAGEWTITVPGLYLILGRVKWFGVAPGQVSARVQVNGTTVANIDRNDNDNDPTLQLAAVEALSGGDQVLFQVRQTTGGTVAIEGEDPHLSNIRIAMLGRL